MIWILCIKKKNDKVSQQFSRLVWDVGQDTLNLTLQQVEQYFCRF